MAIQIITGKQKKPTKGIIYAPEGVGKSTIASHFPNPIFIDVEGGTSRLDVARTQRPITWGEFVAQLNSLATDPQGFQTVVIDTADWAERLAIADICLRNNYKGLGGNGDYGASFNELAKMWGDLLTMMESDFIDSKKMHVLFLAHAITRKFELPEEQGQFDRYSVKLEKKTAPILTEWADCQFFCNYKTIVEVDDKRKTAKGLGGTQRVLYTQHCASWDAKNRDGLPYELPMEFKHIAVAFPPLTGMSAVQSSAEPVAQAPVASPPVASPHAPVTASAAHAQPAAPILAPLPGKELVESAQHKSLRQMMQVAGVSYDQVHGVIIERGRAKGNLKYPEGTPFLAIEPKFIQDYIFPNWDKFLELIAKRSNA